jgi:hypothetical protein
LIHLVAVDVRVLRPSDSPTLMITKHSKVPPTVNLINLKIVSMLQKGRPCRRVSKALVILT